MKYREVKEILKIAAELDGKGLLAEADRLDKIATDIINFEERASEMKRRNWPPEEDNDEFNNSEEAEVINLSDVRGLTHKDEFGDYTDAALEKVLEFISNNLSPESEVMSFDGDAYPLEDLAENNSADLKEYMTEVIPEKLFDLSGEIEETDMGEVLRFVEDVATYLPSYETDETYKFLIDAMIFYMKDYQF
jgi:hypothetical protein